MENYPVPSFIAVVSMNQKCGLTGNCQVQHSRLGSHSKSNLIMVLRSKPKTGDQKTGTSNDEHKLTGCLD